MASNKRKSNSVHSYSPDTGLDTLVEIKALMYMARHGPVDNTNRRAVHKRLERFGYAEFNRDNSYVRITRKGLIALDDLMYALWPETAKVMGDSAKQNNYLFCTH